MIYFVVAYFKKYPTKIHDSILCNLIIALTSIVLLYPLVYSYHLLVDNGAYYNSPSEILVLWSSFIFVVFGLTMLNIFRNLKFKNKLISTLANASLINYVLVNNGFVVTIIIKIFFNKLILPNFGTNYIVLWRLLINLGYFIVGCIVTLLYSISIGNLIKRLTNLLGEKLEIIYNKFFNRFIKKENKNYSD